jgi:hypothetical protein
MLVEVIAVGEAAATMEEEISAAPGVEEMDKNKTAEIYSAVLFKRRLYPY